MQMDIQKTKHQINLEKWRMLVYECRNSGQTIKAWCKERQIVEGTYYRWQKRVWESAVSNQSAPISSGTEITFAEYHRPASIATGAPSALTIQIGHMKLEIQNGADSETIENTIRALQKLC